jgi:putative endonuclease
MRNSLGAFGESWAVSHLTRLGYRIMDRNVRYRTGELDIVAEDGGDTVFVEVKCRRSSTFGSPEASIDRKRFGRLEQTIGEYLAERKLEPPSYRVDVVAIEVDAQGRVSRCEVLRGVEQPTQ